MCNIQDWPYGIGLGTAELDKEQPEKMAELIEQAVLSGYRFLDTAYSYGTEEILGKALKSLFARGVSRDELFIQTKFYPVMPYDGSSVRPQLQECLERLGLDFVDSYLIHQPVPRYSELSYAQRNICVWKEMEALQEEGTVKHIGVSNFLERHVLQITENCRVVPEIREKYAVSRAQIALKWNLQMGNVPICSSRNLLHLQENRKLDFEIAPEDMEQIRLCNSATAHRTTWWYPRQQMY